MEQLEEIPNKFSVEMEYSGMIQATHNFGMFEYFQAEVEKKWPDAGVVGMIRHNLEGCFKLSVYKEDGDEKEIVKQLQEDGKIRYSDITLLLDQLTDFVGEPTNSNLGYDTTLRYN